MSGPELKPCPFCGVRPHIHDDASHSTAFFVDCYNDNCTIQPSAYGLSKAEAIAAWNTRAPITVQDAAETDAERFDRADWFWRVMDPDDSADTPAEAIHRGMIGDYCVCEIASSYTGPVRFGFTAPVLDPDSDDTEFLHFATQQEAIVAAKARSAALRALTEGK